MEILIWMAALEITCSFGKDHLPPEILAITIIVLTIPLPGIVLETIKRGVNSSGPFWNAIALTIPLALTPWNITRYINQLDPILIKLPDVLTLSVAFALLVIIPASLYLTVLLKVYSR